VEPHVDRRGALTTEEVVDPAFPKCNWKLPPARPDSVVGAVQGGRVARQRLPDARLPYAAALNLVTNEAGLPIDASGKVIDAATNPKGLAQFRDLNAMAICSTTRSSSIHGCARCRTPARPARSIATPS